jgi:hypothetical protein
MGLKLKENNTGMTFYHIDIYLTCLLDDKELVVEAENYHLIVVH